MSATVLHKEALVLAAQLTTTDIAVRLGHAQVGDPSKVAHLDQTFAEKVYQKLANWSVKRLIA